MFIKKIKGTYGIFRDEEIYFKNGLNIIKRDNEWGKTTLISLIKVMFYGINTSKRDKKDFLSEKTKYASEVNFNGEMLIDDNGREISVSRMQNARSMTFNSYYTDTNQKTPFTSKDFGKNMLGVSEDSYANSALFEADNRLISKSSDLLDLILAMSTTGDTSKSFDKAMKILKSQKQSITKSSGKLKLSTDLLSRLEKDILLSEKIEAQLDELSKMQQKADFDLKEKRELYESKYRQISVTKLELFERANIIKAQSDQIIANLKPDFYEIQIISTVKDMLLNFEQIENQEYDLRLKLNQLTLEVAKEINEINQEREQEVKNSSKVIIKKIPFFISIVFAITTFFTTFFEFDMGEYTEYSPYILLGITLLSLMLSFSANKDYGNLHIKYDDQIEVLNRKVNDLKNEHQSAASKIENSFESMVNSAKNIGLFHAKSKDDVRERINFVLDINSRYLKAISFEENTKDDANIYNQEKIIVFENELEILKQNLNISENRSNQIVSEIMRNQVRLDQITSKNQLIHQKTILQKEISDMTFDVDSLDIAIETLTLANENLTARLSPEISKIASHYFAFLTENRYNTVILQSDFEAFCKSPDNYNMLSKLKLSTGTREQLYFSLRLAICDVLLDKDVPIILDDPFAFYDDSRMEKALDLLTNIAKNRQILLFTCHSREEKYLDFN